MPRRRYRYDKKTGNLVEIGADTPSTPRRGPMIIGDIDPYKSIITGEEITGRRQHREHLRTHGVEEIGNEHLPPRQPIPLPPAAQDIKESFEKVRSGYRPSPVPTYRDNEFE